MSSRLRTASASRPSIPSDSVTASKYDSLSGRRIAKAVDGELSWIHSGHLYSAAILTDDTNTEVWRLAHWVFWGDVKQRDSDAIDTGGRRFRLNDGSLPEKAFSLLFSFLDKVSLLDKLF